MEFRGICGPVSDEGVPEDNATWIIDDESDDDSEELEELVESPDAEEKC